MIAASYRHLDHIHGLSEVAAKRGDSRAWMVSPMPLFVRWYSKSLKRLQSEQCLTMIRKLAIDYVNFIKECWVHASVSLPPMTSGRKRIDISIRTSNLFLG